VAARVVLSCLGSYGDLFPYLGLAIRLKSLGHEPVVATCPYYRSIVEGEGLEFRPVRPDVDPADSELLKRVMDPKRGSEVVINELAVPAARDAFADLMAATEDADFLVTHPIAFAGPLVAGVRQLPWMSTVLAPISFFSAYDFPALPNAPQVVHLTRLSPWIGRGLMAMARSITRKWTTPILAFRQELGLPAVGDPLYEGQFSPYGTLAMYSRVLGQPQADWPARTHLTGFVFYQQPGGLSAELEAFFQAGPPPVVFTLGSSAVGAAGSFYDESVRAASAAGLRAVLLVGRQGVNQIAGSLPAGMMTVDYAPHALVFERAAAIVHHGGVGTTGQALRSGRPMLVVPHAHDQPDNAHRVKSLGVARVLDARKYKAASVAGHLRALVGDASYQRRASQVAREVRAEHGADTACDLIVAAIESAPRLRRGRVLLAQARPVPFHHL
jgi:UDP:flavonoid glycosyltransferase YjiC (YdhE family)